MTPRVYKRRKDPAQPEEPAQLARVRRLNDKQVEVTTVRVFDTVIPCPCKCGVMIKIGTYGHLGGGQAHCPHCSVSAGAGGWKTTRDFMKHYNGKVCKTSRGDTTTAVTAKTALDNVVVRHVNRANNYVMVENVKRFKCSICATDKSYTNRYEHTKLCLQLHQISFPARNARSFRKDLVRTRERLRANAQGANEDA